MAGDAAHVYMWLMKWLCVVLDPCQRGKVACFSGFSPCSLLDGRERP